MKTRKRAAAICVGLALLLAGLTAPSAQAAFGFLPGPEGFAASAENPDGTTATQAGSHPYAFTTELNLNETLVKGHPFPDGDIRDAHVSLPPGLIGNPTVIAQCTQAQFETPPPNPSFATSECPNSSVIGTATIRILSGTVITEVLPVFNLAPPPGVPAEFGFNFSDVPVALTPHLRADGSYGLTVDSTNISQTLPVFRAKVTIWGVPYDSSHDTQRGTCIEPLNGKSVGSCPIAGTAKAYLTLPASCTGLFTTKILADSWQSPGAYLPNGEPDLTDPNWASAESVAPGLDGCNKVPFGPTIAAQPTTNQTTSPTGLNFDLNFADEGLTNPAGVAQSEIKKAVVTLPEGFSLNPSAAAGLSACSQAAYEAISLRSEAGCPESSKIGDVEITSPIVEQKIDGSLYVAKQNANPFGSLLALYIVAENSQIGVLIKSAGEVKLDPVTGQLLTTVDNIPQLPFSHFRLSFHQGQTSPLVTPPACGTYTATADLTPWSNPEATLHDTSSFQITAGTSGGPCPSGGVPPFHPELLAGTLNNRAGSYSPFYTHITRHDSEQEITRFSIKLPPGVIGKLASVSSCSDAQIAAAKAREHEGGGGEEQAAPSCPANSEVGHSLVGAGVGNVLAYAPGKLYLAGPYHGSQLSLVSITAAKVGPFDLGTVVVRFALKIDPETAEVSVDGVGSDPIPHIVDGIPTHLRDLRAYVDRPNFTLNPTSCAKKSTASTVLGSGLNFVSPADDVPVTVSSPFQAADCASLGFKPALKLSLKGSTKRSGVPRFKAVLTYPKKGAYANIAKAQVTLPSSEFLEQNHIGTVCTRVQFAEGTTPGEKCPAASIYGHASAITPLLDGPISGPVYLRANGGERELPDLVAALHSGQINVDLVGFIDSVHKKGSEVSRIRNTFAAVPDAPVSKFTLELLGGKKGLLVNSTNICKGTHRALAAFTGQNGKLHNFNPPLEAQCGGKKKGKKGARKSSLGFSHR